MYVLHILPTMYRTIKMMMTTPFGKNMGFLSFLRSKFCPVKGGIQGTQMLTVGSICNYHKVYHSQVPIKHVGHNKRAGTK